MNLRRILAASLILLSGHAFAFAGDESAYSAPKPVAATRTELKEQLERSKQSKPRLPLPPPTEAELEAAKANSGRGAMSGIINNGRMRKLYLPPEVLGGGFSREPDPVMTLNNTYKTMFFWIVSRANNCTYCSGHQEVKLLGDGVTEEIIAALDSDWSEFTSAERAAFDFTRKLTFTPHQISDADLAQVRKHYNDLQILEILIAVGGFNAMNRWTGALAIPQEDHREYLTSTPDKFKNARSLVAPLADDAAVGAPARLSNRGPLETHEQVEAALSAARKRTPRLPLATEEQARGLVPTDWPSTAPLSEWVRLLANFPKGGKAWIAQSFYSETKGKLAPKLKADIAYISARNDRAWYALGHATRRLKDLGLSDAGIALMDKNDESLPVSERLVIALAAKLTTDPARITDSDIEGLRKHFSDHEVAEIVYHVTQAAFFDRVTEVAGLRLEN